MTQSPSTAPLESSGQAVELHAELPFDPAGFVSPAILMAPGYVESPAVAEQLPFVFWLCGAVTPRVTVDIGAVDATIHFGLCQAADTISPDARCHLGGMRLDPTVRKDVARIQKWIDHQNSHHGARSQIIGGSHGDLVGQLKKKSVDLLVLHARAADSEQLRLWKKELWPMLSPRAVVLVDGIGDGAHEFFDTLAKEGPGFRFDHGIGFGVVAPGSAPPELMLHLAAQAGNAAAAEALRNLFRRLGLGCRQAADHRLLNRFRAKFNATAEEASALREELGLKEARLVGREAEILELRDRLDWHRDKLEQAEQDLIGSRARAHRLGEASAGVEAELQKSRKELARQKEARKRAAADLEDARRELNKQKRAAQALREQLESVYSSRSWKIMAPLRRFMPRFRSRLE